MYIIYVWRRLRSYTAYLLFNYFLPETTIFHQVIGSSDYRIHWFICCPTECWEVWELHNRCSVTLITISPRSSCTHIAKTVDFSSGINPFKALHFLLLLSLSLSLSLSVSLFVSLAVVLLPFGSANYLNHSLLLLL